MSLFDESDPAANFRADLARFAEQVYQAKRAALIDAYAAELLERPPVRSVAPEALHREREARRLATKDVDRLLKAMTVAGLMLMRKEV